MSQTPDRDLPVSFSSFVVSLASSAMVNLGEVHDPASSGQGTDLAIARQTIDLLGVLEEKTRGNLDEEEAKLLESVLYDLRLKFVEKRKERDAGQP